MDEKQYKEIEADNIEVEDNEYKIKYGELRNSISSSRDKLSLSLLQTKKEISKTEDVLHRLREQENKLQGAIEVTESFLRLDLPSNNKINAK